MSSNLTGLQRIRNCDFLHALAALLVTTIWVGLVRLWATVRASWREGTPRGRWRACFWTITMLVLVSGAARLALRLAALETGPSAPDWPGRLTGTLTGVLVVTLLAALAILTFAGSRTEFSRDLAAVVVTLLLVLPAYLFIDWDELTRQRLHVPDRRDPGRGRAGAVSHERAGAEPQRVRPRRLGGRTAPTPTGYSRTGARERALRCLSGDRRSTRPCGRCTPCRTGSRSHTRASR